MSDRRETIRKEILSLFRNHGRRAFRPKEVARKLGYRDNMDYRLARSILEELSEKGEITSVKGNRFMHHAPAGRLEGRLSVHPAGYGFVSVEGHKKDFFVRSRRMNTALDGDLVRIGIAARRAGDERQQAEILEVLERPRKSAVGTFEHSGSFAIVIPDDNRLTHDIFVDLDSVGQATDGDKVVVSIDAFEHAGAAPRGRILKIIGRASDPMIQTISLAMSLGVDVDFPAEVEEEASGIELDISPSEEKLRQDFRERIVFTIDPDDARDFDDALHIHALGNSRFEVGIHIADVSHYVRAGSLVDIAAAERATSVYLVDRVIPMLPEVLSNEICSLKPGVDRLAFSCIFELDGEGTVFSSRVVESIICSAHRLSYEEAQEILDGQKPDHPLAEGLRTVAAMARSLRERRFENGAIDFDIQEVRVELDENAHPLRIVPRIRQESNRLIEEFMLLANRTIATEFASEDRVFAFRVHDPPDAERITQLARYVSAFGHELPHDDGTVDPKALNKLLRSVENRPEAAVIEQAALRSMSRARYDVQNRGHYGLAAPFYTHFTSPIRRYPDLVVHRLVKLALASRPSPEPEMIADVLQHCSEREVVATQAERESIKLKKVEFVQDHIGEQFTGVISGVSKFGVYVAIDSLLVEGMVHVRDMGDDYYEYDEASFSLIGTRSGTRYRPGDRVVVLIAGASIEKREIDLAFVPGSAVAKRYQV